MTNTQDKIKELEQGCGHPTSYYDIIKAEYIKCGEITKTGKIALCPNCKNNIRGFKSGCLAQIDEMKKGIDNLNFDEVISNILDANSDEEIDDAKLGIRLVLINFLEQKKKELTQ